MTSNEQIANAIKQIEPYRLKWSGQEVDTGLEMIFNMNNFMANNIQVPYTIFSGGVTTLPIAKFDKPTWIHSVILKCERAFTDASQITNYSINARSIAKIVNIPSEFFQMEGDTLELILDIPIGPDIWIDLVADNAISQGTLHVKLVLN